MPTTINDVRFSYCNLFQSQARPGQEAKYSTTILVPKSNARAKAVIDQAVVEAINQGVAKKWQGVRPPQPALCIHDGDGPRPSDGQPYGDECKDCWVLTAYSTQQPFIVDANVQPIIDPREVYSGMWGNVNINFYAYNQNGKKGIGCGLNGVQKIRDGEALSGRVTAQEVFQPVAAPASQPGYAPASQPVYTQPTINPITGQPCAPAGTPIMGL